MRLAGQRLERELPALARRAGRPAAGGAGAVAFLDQGVPLAAGLALALPAAEAAPQFWQTKVRLRRDMVETWRSVRSGRRSHQENISRTLTGSGLPDPVVAAAEAGQHLVGDGAGLRCRPRRRSMPSPISVTSLPRRTALSGRSVTSTRHQVHRDAARRSGSACRRRSTSRAGLRLR